MPFCKACGDELGDPTQELHDPDNDYEIVEGGVSNPESAHLKVVKGEKGVRMNCTREKAFTKIVNEPPNSGGSPSGGGGSEPKQSKPKRPPKQQEVYDLPQEKSAMEILDEVAGTPVFELNDAQVQELMSWGDIYDGQIPPDVVEDILSNFSGVSKQTAAIIKQKYEAKLNKWIREKSRDTGGPSIGASTSIPRTPPANSNGGGEETNTEQKPAPPPRPSPDSSSSDDDLPSDPLEMSKKRRNKRQSRRQEMLDQAMDEFAAAAAQNMAGEVGKGFTQMRDVFFTLIKNKAKKDPDWFFEKMDEWDMDILDEFLSMSEARQQELGGGGDDDGFSVDMDIDNALDETLNDEVEPDNDISTGDSEKTKRDAPISDNDNPMKASPGDVTEDEVETDEDEVFDELMGDVSE